MTSADQRAREKYEVIEEISCNFDNMNQYERMMYINDLMELSYRAALFRRRPGKYSGKLVVKHDDKTNRTFLIREKL